MERIKLAEIEPEQVLEDIGAFVIKAVGELGKTGCVIGLSGGVDSTTTAAIIKKAFDRHKEDAGVEYNLVGYILPSKTNNGKDTEDGVKVAERLGIRYETHSIEGIIEAHEKTNPGATSDKYHRGNLSSRVRANVLNTKAATEDKLVAGTGNRDEDYGIGYYTLFGDGAVHISPIGELPKRLVRQMAEHLGFKDLANREPTAGLEPGQTDFKDLGYRYDAVELIIAGKDQGFSKEELAVHPQVRGIVEPQLEEYQKTFGKYKFNTADEIIYDVLKRHQIARKKVEIVSPPVAPIMKVYK